MEKPLARRRGAVRSTGLAFGILFTAVALVSVNLRPGASSVGPVLEELRSGLGMSATVAGAMTGLPGLVFGLVGAVSVAFARRVGMTAGITIGLVAAALGLLLRVTTGDVPLFLVLTVVGLAGMAVGNVLVPAWIKAHGHAVGEGGEPAADEQSRGNRDEDPPGRCRELPEEISGDEQLDQPPRNRDRPGKDELRQAARQRPPRHERERDHAFADRALGGHGRNRRALNRHDDARPPPAAAPARAGPCRARRQ